MDFSEALQIALEISSKEQQRKFILRVCEARPDWLEQLEAATDCSAHGDFRREPGRQEPVSADSAEPGSHCDTTASDEKYADYSQFVSEFQDAEQSADSDQARSSDPVDVGATDSDSPTMINPSVDESEHSADFMFTRSHHADDRYELLDEVGSGGMGTILRGRDQQLGRELAIKVLKENHLESPRILQQFIKEAQIGGQLQHPGIAPVYDMGRFKDARPFFSMKLVKGKTLAQLMKESWGPADEASLIHVFEQVCQTMAYAHSRNVIHRDLKPANIMVGKFGEIQVMDWGLAKVVSGELGEPEPTHDAETNEPQSLIQTGIPEQPDLGQTKAGSLMGTPGYMSPEQANGAILLIDYRTDVFALGAILFEIVMRRPLYLGLPSVLVKKAAEADHSDAIEELEQTSIDPQIASLICDCIEFNPKKRPANAAEVASRLSDYLNSVQLRLHKAELAKAQAITRADEALRRREAYVVAAGLLLILAIGAVVFAIVFRSQRVQQEDLRRIAENRKKEADNQRTAAEKNLQDSRKNEAIAKANEQRAIANQAKANLQEQKAREEAEKRRRINYATDMQLAPLMWESEFYSAARLDEVLSSYEPNDGKPDLRSFEWYYHKKALSDRALIVATPVHRAVWHDDHRFITVTSKGRLQWRSAETGQVIRERELPGNQIIRKLDITSDAQFIAIGNENAIHVVHSLTGDLQWTQPLESKMPLLWAKFSADNHVLVAMNGSGRRRETQAWEVKTGQRYELTFMPLTIHGDALDFSDERRIGLRLFGPLRRNAAIGSWANGELNVQTILEGAATLNSVRLSRDASVGIVTSTSQATVVLVDFKRGRVARHQDLHVATISDTCFSAEGTQLATAGGDGLIKIWNIKTGSNGPDLELVEQLKGHLRAPQGLQFSPDGKKLLSFDRKQIRIWHLRETSSLMQPIEIQGTCSELAVSPDGKWLVCAEASTNELRVRHAATGQIAWKRPVDERVTSIAFSADSQQLAVGHHRSKITIWDMQQKKQVGELLRKLTQHDVLTMAFSSDGKTLISGYGHDAGHRVAFSTRARVWEVTTYQEQLALPRAVETGKNNACSAAVFSPDTKLLITSNHNGRIIAYDTASWKPITSFENRGNPSVMWGRSVAGLAVRNDASDLVVAVASEGGSVTEHRLVNWNNRDSKEQSKAARFKLAATYQGHTDAVMAVTYSPNKKTMASAGLDGTVRLWNLTSGREVLRLQSDVAYYSIAFSPDGRSLYAGGATRNSETASVNVWRTQPQTRNRSPISNLGQSTR